MSLRMRALAVRLRTAMPVPEGARADRPYPSQHDLITEAPAVERAPDLGAEVPHEAGVVAGNAGAVAESVGSGRSPLMTALGPTPAIRSGRRGGGREGRQARHRVDTARSRDEGGAGLGLAIAAWIARAHGGSIAASSLVAVGSAFSVCLPLASATAVDPDRSVVDPTAPSPQVAARPSVWGESP